MCSTPAPPFTAFVASSIWSGVGDVNTSPGQAASSIPGPTNPPCMGSCPEPPPETSPTFPRTGASPRTTRRFSRSTRNSGWAAAMPRSASGTTSAGALISFFTGAPLPESGGQGGPSVLDGPPWGGVGQGPSGGGRRGRDRSGPVGCGRPAAGVGADVVVLSGPRAGGVGAAGEVGVRLDGRAAGL